MSRSPLAYPLTRGVDADAGGAADLQTDIMRFMAILALCLVAIFALVQSLPMTPAAPVVAETIVEVKEAPTPEPPAPVISEPEPAPGEHVVMTRPEPAPQTAPEPVRLTRPQWTSNFQPRPRPQTPTELTPEPAPVRTAAASPPVVVEQAPNPPVNEPDGFTLRFESDLALTRLVASGQVGFYAIESGRARRMAVSDSRISFWDASTPNTFHEMEATTVPRPVVDALTRTGADTSGINWGVTLPGRLSRRLDTLMREHSGGALVITASGEMDLERS